jgi:hypothetical protein
VRGPLSDQEEGEDLVLPPYNPRDKSILILYLRVIGIERPYALHHAYKIVIDDLRVAKEEENKKLKRKFDRLSEYYLFRILSIIIIIIIIIDY